MTIEIMAELRGKNADSIGTDTPEEAPKVSQKARKALADVIATYGLTRKQALIAIAEIFANQK